MALRWSSPEGLDRNLLYAGSATVLVPAECFDGDGNFVIVPSRPSAGGFVVVDVRPGDVRAVPGNPGACAWDVFRDRQYRVMRTGSRNGAVRGAGDQLDEAYFQGEDVLAVYVAAVSDKGREELLAKALGRAPAEEGRKAGGRDYRVAAVKVPEELVLQGGGGCGIVFPDPEAMGGVGFVGAPGARYDSGRLELGGWAGRAWRLRSRTMVPVAMPEAVAAAMAGAVLYGKAPEAARKRFMFVKPESPPAWPEFHGRDVVLRDVPVGRVSRTDLPGTCQVAVPLTDGGMLFALVPEAAVLASGKLASVALGRSDMPVACRGPSGEAYCMDAGKIMKSAAPPRPEAPRESVVLHGISRADVETDYSRGTSDVLFDGPDGATYGVRVPMEALQEGDDGFLAVSLGDPEDTVRCWRGTEDGMQEVAEMPAANAASLVERAVAAMRGGKARS